ncbi:LacI family DNA-binding transcriptional regulator [Deefgea piscis]|uniref:LacI family DNA-binding transcriptional regulator n=1 Tax=Deefgea piscis TaxID=2739061 RepID=UPI001C806A35|nr:LacI family DNA-binding transcriptional regulator [Deefgea piscis]QZA81731.1 LacI family DNA-binding transcriptional regulator [Deefgea piscis]
MRSRFKPAVKLDDVAAHSGVSPSTVSLYMRHPDKVSAKSAEKISRAIEELGYVRNKIASQFTGGARLSMAVIVPSVANIIFGEAVQLIEKIVSEEGFQLLIASHNHSLEKEEAQVRSFLEWSPAAIALAGPEHTDATIKMLQQSGVPVVQMWQVEGQRFSAQVGVDHFSIGYHATRYLYETGCQKVAFFTTRFEEDVRAGKRYTGYLKAVAEQDQLPIVVNVPQSDNIYTATRPLLLKTMIKERGLDGIVASNDGIGAALLIEAADKGIAVPDKLSVLGFGDFPISAHLAPASLSTINIHAPCIAETTGKMMLRMNRDIDYQGDIVDVGYEIIPRGSTRLVI